MQDTDGYMCEQVLALGDDERVVAIATPARDAAGDLAVVILNAGVLHRVGPHRLHVRLARALAARGIPALRIDLSGIGDSRPVPGEMSFRASSVADARAAMDRLAADLGVRRFVLFGLCSGADNAIAAAEADPRVVGLVAVDPMAHATRAARWRAVRQRWRREGIGGLLAGLAGALRRRLDRRRPATAGDAAPAAAPAPAPTPATARDAQGRGLAALADRGAAALLVYSGALGARYNHPDQLYEVFPGLRGRVHARWFPGANHTFTELAAQATLIEATVDWCRALARPRAS